MDKRTRDVRAHKELEASRKVGTQALGVESAVFEGALVVLKCAFNGGMVCMQHKLLCRDARGQGCA